MATRLRDKEGRFVAEAYKAYWDVQAPVKRRRSVRATLHKDLKIGLLLLVALNLFDLASTFTAIRLGAHEANPLARLLLGFSPLTLIALKAVVVGLILFASAKVPVERVVTRVWLLVGVYAMVALNNAVVVWRLTHAA